MPSSRVPRYQVLPLLLHDPTRLPNSVGTAVCYLWFRSTLPARPCRVLRCNLPPWFYRPRLPTLPQAFEESPVVSHFGSTPPYLPSRVKHLFRGSAASGRQPTYKLIRLSLMASLFPTNRKRYAATPCETKTKDDWKSSPAPLAALWLLEALPNFRDSSLASQCVLWIDGKSGGCPGAQSISASPSCTRRWKAMFDGLKLKPISTSILMGLLSRGRDKLSRSIRLLPSAVAPNTTCSDHQVRVNGGFLVLSLEFEIDLLFRHLLTKPNAKKASGLL